MPPMPPMAPGGGGGGDDWAWAAAVMASAPAMERARRREVFILGIRFLTTCFAYVGFVALDCPEAEPSGRRRNKTRRCAGRVWPLRRGAAPAQHAPRLMNGT